MALYAYPVLFFYYYILFLQTRKITKDAQSTVVSTTILQTLIWIQIYANLIYLAGPVLGEGLLLRILSLAIYVLEALVNPLLIILALDLAARIRTPGADSRAAGIVAWLAVAGLVVFEFLQGNLNPDLQLLQGEGVLLYLPAETRISLSVVVVLAAMAIAGAILWLRIGWPWVFLGTAFLLLVTFTNGLPFGPLLLLAAEALFYGALLATDFRLNRQTFELSETELDSRLSGS